MLSDQLSSTRRSLEQAIPTSFFLDLEMLAQSRNRERTGPWSAKTHCAQAP